MLDNCIQFDSSHNLKSVNFMYISDYKWYMHIMSTSTLCQVKLCDTTMNNYKYQLIKNINYI